MLASSPQQSIPGCFVSKAAVDKDWDDVRAQPVIGFAEARMIWNLRLTFRLQCQQFIRRAMINPGAGSVA